MSSRFRASRDDHGFTLIELLVVISIIGVLAAIATFSVSKFRGRAVSSACKTDYKSIELAQEAYKTKTGSYPTEAQLKDGTSTLLKTFPGTADYVFTVSGSTITIGGPRVVGTAAAGTDLTAACAKK